MYTEYKDSGKTAPKPSAYSLSKKWTLERPDWSKEVARGPQTQTILNLGKAYINFWNGRGRAPAFKKKGCGDSFTVDNTKAKTIGRKISLPNIGWVKMRESLRLAGKIMSYTVSQKAGQWHVSIQVEMEDIPVKKNPSRVGVDVGIRNLAVASDGTACPNPLNLEKRRRYLIKLQRKMARQKKGSNRRESTKLRIAKAHLRITNVRQDAIHKFTSTLAKNHGSVVVETLDIMGMVEQGKRYLRRQFQDTAMREVHRQLEYKMGDITYAPRFFPSSKTCSSCGTRKIELPCGIRVYKCEACGLVLDRDLNAARNLENQPWVTG